MSVAPAKSGTVPPPSPDIVWAREKLRMPRIRHAVHLIVPRVVQRNGVDRVAVSRVSVSESKGGVRLCIDVDDDGIGVKCVDLSLPEVAALGDALNRMRRRVADRKDWRP